MFFTVYWPFLMRSCDHSNNCSMLCLCVIFFQRSYSLSFSLSLVFNCLKNDVPRCGSLQLYPVWVSWNHRIFKFKLLTKFLKFGLLFLQILFSAPFSLPSMSLTTFTHLSTFSNCSIYLRGCVDFFLLFRLYTFYWFIFKLWPSEESHKKGDIIVFHCVPCSRFQFSYKNCPLLLHL